MLDGGEGGGAVLRQVRNASQYIVINDHSGHDDHVLHIYVCDVIIL